ncbi:Rpn family recombination-promoting nuclease/putative transposase [Marinospirillum sp.]|uniref:Rpn family recombination-promoting nuclease/putative transposase n=1 Tax=Marinospirillum sp. TaxID=2183934 RepID=UPI00385055E4
MSHHHDTGYKEVFSYPELIQQLIEGFVPEEVAEMMDFSTLKLENGNYITPLFEEKHEDLVWSVEVTWQGSTQRVYLYLLMEFQSSIDTTMPIRLMHYVSCFYSQLIKSKSTSTRKGLPPVFSLVLYNGLQRWKVPDNISGMIHPQPPLFLKDYQPALRYYLIDEGAYTDEELAAKSSSVSGIFAIEKASSSRERMQQAVDRMVQIIRKDPNKERIDQVITRWLKRHFYRLGDRQNWDRIHSLIEDHAMIAENIQTWAQKERMEGLQEGYQQAKVEAEQRLEEMVLNMVQAGLPDGQVVNITGITPEQLAAIKDKLRSH